MHLETGKPPRRFGWPSTGGFGPAARFPANMSGN